MKHRIIPAIMSGGSGTRLWPASTDTRPKQFHAFGCERSLILETLERVRGETAALSFAPPIILGNVEHRALIEAQMAEAGVTPSAIVLEPIGRNTAATAAVAAALAAEIAPDALVLLMPADHLVADRSAFLAALERGAAHARTHIVTLGIEPTAPETGYGYIKRGSDLTPGVFTIEAFTEKPDEKTARSYLDQGGFFWNAGMFLFAPALMLEEFGAAPGIRDGAIKALERAERSGVRITLDDSTFRAIEDKPVDKAVMEKTSRAAVAIADMGWADIGSWSEVWRLSPRDAHGNALEGPVATLDARNLLVRSEGVKVCVAGVEDLVVVATAEAVLILPRARAQDVKKLKELAAKL